MKPRSRFPIKRPPRGGIVLAEEAPGIFESARSAEEYEVLRMRRARVGV